MCYKIPAGPSFAIFLQVYAEGAPDRPPADEAVQRRVSAGDHRER